MTKTIHRLWFFILVLMTNNVAQAAPINFIANLLGPSESPPNSSTATGFADAILDLSAQTLRVQIGFSGLEGLTTASHIHCCTSSPESGNAGVATTIPSFTGFPLGVSSGSYDHTFDLTQSSSYNPTFLSANGGTASGAEIALAEGLENGEAYLNIHTSLFPGGEIEGFLQRAATLAEPTSALLIGVGLIVLAGRAMAICRFKFAGTDKARRLQI